MMPSRNAAKKGRHKGKNGSYRELSDEEAQAIIDRRMGLILAIVLFTQSPQCPDVGDNHPPDVANQHHYGDQDIHAVREFQCEVDGAYQDVDGPHPTVGDPHPDDADNQGNLHPDRDDHPHPLSCYRLVLLFIYY